MDEALSILVVDDHPFYVDTLAAVLGVNGFIVHKAYSGEKALEILQDHPVDILLTDVNMPGMDGVELYRKTKKIHPSISAIFMTAYAPNELIEQGRAEGVKAILEKPLDFDFLVTLISSIKRINTNSQ